MRKCTKIIETKERKYSNEDDVVSSENAYMSRKCMTDILSLALEMLRSWLI